VLFAGRDNRLMAVPVEPRRADLTIGVARPLFDARPVGPRGFFAASPDGDRFLVNVLRGERLATTITLLQNWRAALTP
jgi:hypothetical protein